LNKYHNYSDEKKSSSSMPIGRPARKPWTSPCILWGCSEKLSSRFIYQTSCRHHCWICIRGLLLFIFTIYAQRSSLLSVLNLLWCFTLLS